MLILSTNKKTDICSLLLIMKMSGQMISSKFFYKFVLKEDTILDNTEKKDTLCKHNIEETNVVV